MKTIIAIVGLPGAGKSEASDYFKEKNIPVIRFGAITDKALEVKGQPETQEYEKDFRENLRKEFGMAAFAIKNESRINEALEDSDIVVLDGLRSWEEYEYLKSKLTKLLLLAIYASPLIRHQRLKVRKLRHLSIQESINRDIAEIINLNMAPPIALADYLIKNETSLEDFRRELNNFLKKIT